MGKGITVQYILQSYPHKGHLMRVGHLYLGQKAGVRKSTCMHNVVSQRNGICNT